ncbi:hypothetical protein ES703_86897 [subsurface metagenome]
MEKPYRFKKKLVKTGGSFFILIPSEWLKQRAEKLKKKVIEFLDVLIYDKYIEIRPSEK